MAIQLFFGRLQFRLTEIENDKFRFCSANTSRFASSVSEAINFCTFEVEREAEQIREFNSEFPKAEPISLFRIPSEIEGLVNLERMQFSNAVYIGNEPYKLFDI